MTYPSKAEHLDQAPAFLSITVVRGDSLTFLIKPVYIHEDPSNPGVPIEVPADLTKLTWESDILDATGRSIGKFTIEPDSTHAGLVKVTIDSSETDSARPGSYRHWVRWHDNNGYQKTAYAGPFNVVDRGHGVLR